jgi:GR25 family glycosyltransferase involved in LPS biosynthesis
VSAAITPDLHLDQLFTHTVCLNLDRRPERWRRMQQRFARHGISNVVRFSAIDGERVDLPERWQASAGAYGCLQSNLAVVRQARDEGWPDVLLLEDDVVFDDALNARLPQLMAQVPPDWDMLFFGGMHRGEPLRVRENVLKLTASTSTYAYAVRNTVYSAFLHAHADSSEPIDVRNRVLQERLNCYCFFPHLAWVDGGLSDTQGRFVEPWWLKESMVLGGPAMDRLQQRTLVVVVDRAGAPEALARRNVAYATSAYRRLLNGATVVVVDQRGPFCGRSVNEAVGQFGAGKDFYVFADRDVVPTWDAKAHLVKCADYGAASCFRRLIDLTEADSARFVDGTPIDGSPYSARARQGIFAECCTMTRQAFQQSGGWDETLAIGDEADRPSRTALEPASVFDSPGLGLRLFSGRSAVRGLNGW